MMISRADTSAFYKRLVVGLGKQFKMKACLVAVVVIVAAVFPDSGVLGKVIPEDQLSFSQDLPTVTIPDGKIIGTYNVTFHKQTPYVAFRGIPYAQPPVGDLRFAAPVKNEKWSGYWDGTKDANICMQGSGDKVTGSEDCLYVSVYAPKGAEDLAVMVWVYGGSFTGGDSSYNKYSPDFLLEDNVVYVAFNYRLGIFGFMSTEDSIVSGNWGLKDQVFALQWVKDNIQYFGGNPERITIFGESAGGASVSYLLQIPKAQGLFNAAIIQSGSSENLWSLTTRARQAAFQVAHNLIIPALTSKTLLKRLRLVEASTLQKTAMTVLTQIYILNPLRGLPWAPCIEVESPEAVFTERSDEYLRSGNWPSKVPVMIGYTSNEAGHAQGVPETLRSYLLRYDVSAVNMVPFSMTSSTITKVVAANEIWSHFFEDGSLSQQFDEVVKFINADQFNRGIIRMAENMAPYVPVYFYVFGYMGQIVGENPYDGAGHAEELSYLFRIHSDNYSDNDLLVKDKLVRLWTNFAKTFNPTPAKEALLDNVIWPTLNSDDEGFNYAWLNLTVSLDTNPAHETYSFYKDLFERRGDGQYTTY